MIKAIFIALLIGVGIPIFGMMMLEAKNSDGGGCLLPFILTAVCMFIVLIIFL